MSTTRESKQWIIELIVLSHTVNNRADGTLLVKGDSGGLALWTRVKNTVGFCWPFLHLTSIFFLFSYFSFAFYEFHTIFMDLPFFVHYLATNLGICYWGASPGSAEHNRMHIDSLFETKNYLNSPIYLAKSC